ncbi:MAG: hypothetical protein K0U24_01560 [Gammaproteobacteria bacterium]|nr:hypothetical protein [Gammaproteobacteria bacterium]MCH9715720.1 hypothetical protein [Gammaproteobacteria bacterium]MCH9762915.1 hypothetical protein [Gammaproteobacteria bacterium]
MAESKSDNTSSSIASAMSPVKAIEGTEAILSAVVNLRINVPVNAVTGLVTGIDKLLKATVSLVTTATSLPSTMIRDITSLPFDIVGAALFPNITGRLTSIVKDVVGTGPITNATSVLGSALSASKQIANTGSIEQALSSTYQPVIKNTIDNLSKAEPAKPSGPNKGPST